MHNPKIKQVTLIISEFLGEPEEDGVRPLFRQITLPDGRVLALFRYSHCPRINFDCWNDLFERDTS